jgi:hypothetical protein
MKKPDKIIILLVCFACLAAATAGAAFSIAQYKPDGPDLIGKSWEISGPEALRKGADDPARHLASGDAETSVRIWQEITDWGGHGRLRLEAALKWEDVRAGKNAWNKARLVLFQYNESERRIEMPDLVAAVDGTGGWKACREVFEISPEARKLKVEAHLSQCTGEMWIDDVGLYGVVQTSLYTWAGRVLLGLWGFFFTVLLVCCLGAVQWRPAWLKAGLVVVFLAVIAGTTIPNDTKNQLKDGLENGIQSVGKSVGADKFIDNMPVDITKVGYFCLFAAAGWLLVVLLPGVRIYKIFAILAMLAAGTELVQFFINERSPLVSDFAIDAAGGIAGTAVALLWVMGSDPCISPDF